MAMRYRYYFIEALVMTMLLFSVGFMFGLGVEKARNNYLTASYLSVEKEIADLGSELDVSNLGKYNCSQLVSRNFELGNEIYNQAKIFQEYEDAAIFTKDQLSIEHRKFDKLRTSFWVNSIRIKSMCGSDVFNTVIYLYNYPATTTEEIAKQRVMERITSDLKDLPGKGTILIPIAKNLGIKELDEQTSKYPGSNESVLLVVNEKIVFSYDDADKVMKTLG
ncbi:Uncharacterised protein [uncultured archaeon]|nr:Uncharacterised protein [uncultured archaeon]